MWRNHLYKGTIIMSEDFKPYSIDNYDKLQSEDFVN
jgi:hypothetical protein